MQQTGIFAGRTEVRCPYARWGWTRGGGKVWHGGLDLAGLDDATIRMPYYKGKRITGRVTRARIVTDRRDKTWEWGYYVCVQLDRGQTPDAVNFLYFAHCASLLVKAGQRVASGDALAVMGNTGNAALADPPDLIITDLMMPKMNGIELIRRLKKDMNTSHIPIIMVTAKTGTDDIKEGYAAGADEYITKPFDASILKIRVDNLIQSREKLKELYSKNFSLESLGVDVTSVDEKFMQKLYATLQQNIANSDLNLDAFCKELGLSKSNLYRKIKQITGYSPNEFIRNFRLETAAKMLKETDMSITEVYCAVGYNSLAYFSNSFKTLYGVSPSEFKNRSEGERE